MSEPNTTAKMTGKIAPDVLHWGVHDDRIDWRSECYAISGTDGAVLIDPLPLQGGALDALDPIRAICLTGSCHQRSAWRYRRSTGAKVYAPEGAEGLEESPDETYAAGTELPGELQAIHAPGPSKIHYALLHRPEGGSLFCADVLIHEPGGAIRFVEAKYLDDPESTRATATGFLDQPFRRLCFAHGVPITDDPKAAIRTLLGS